MQGRVAPTDVSKKREAGTLASVHLKKGAIAEVLAEMYIQCEVKEESERDTQCRNT